MVFIITIEVSELLLRSSVVASWRSLLPLSHISPFRQTIVMSEAEAT